jgi:radical SAM superfamily enzyme
MGTNCILLYGNQDMPLYKSSGVFRIATELRNQGYSVQCIDITAFDNSNTDKFLQIIKNLVSEETLWIGFSTSFLYSIWDLFDVNTRNLRYTQDDLHTSILAKFIQLVKSLNPEIKFISGGSRIFPLKDFGFKIFKGYVDREIVEFTNWCAKKNNKINLDFYSTLIEGTEFKEFNQSQIVYEENDIIIGNEALPIEVSRGCIFRCKFCSFPLNGKSKGDYVKSYDKLIEEFTRNYNNFGTTRYTFSDDTYNDTVDKVKGLYDNVFSKLPFKIEFTTYLRLDLIMRFPEMAEYLKESGLKSSLFGIETLNPKSAKIIGKGIPPREQFQYVEYLKNNEFKNISIMSGIILGLPYDTLDTLEETQEFLLSDKNKMDRFDVFPLHIESKDTVKFNFSEFELNYQKYNYDFYTDHKDRIKWKNLKTGLNYDICRIKADLITDLGHLTGKNKVSGFGYSWHQSLGISSADLDQLSELEIEMKYKISELANKLNSKYISELIRLTTK